MIRSYYTVQLYSLHASQNKQQLFPYLKLSFFLTEAVCVYCAVGTESLNVIQFKFALKKSATQMYVGKRQVP